MSRGDLGAKHRKRTSTSQNLTRLFYYAKGEGGTTRAVVSIAEEAGAKDTVLWASSSTVALECVTNSCRIGEGGEGGMQTAATFFLIPLFCMRTAKKSIVFLPSLGRNRSAVFFDSSFFFGRKLLSRICMHQSPVSSFLLLRTYLFFQRRNHPRVIWIHAQ